MEQRYNMRSPAVKRLMREAMELRDPTFMYYAQPLEDNLFEWHFTIRGPEGTEFEGGFYHGRIILPSEYPMKPPSIILMTPNGRFSLHQKICLSASSYHPELWQPSWSIRTVLLAIIGFMPTEGVGAVGSLDCSTVERRRMAKRSLEWKCDVCGVPNRELLSSGTEEGVQKKAMEEAADIVSQMAFKSEAEVQQQKKVLSQQQQQQKPQQQQQQKPQQQQQQQQKPQQQQQQQQEKKEPAPQQDQQQETDGVVKSGEVGGDTPPATPPVTSSPDDQSDEAGKVGVAREEPQTQLRQRRPQPKSAVSPSSLTPEPQTSSGPPGGFSLFLIVLLLICIFILVARRLIILFLIESSS